MTRARSAGSSGAARTNRGSGDGSGVEGGCRRRGARDGSDRWRVGRDRGLRLTRREGFDALADDRRQTRGRLRPAERPGGDEQGEDGQHAPRRAVAVTSRLSAQARPSEARRSVRSRTGRGRAPGDASVPPAGRSTPDGEQAPVIEQRAQRPEHHERGDRAIEDERDQLAARLRRGEPGQSDAGDHDEAEHDRRGSGRGRPSRGARSAGRSRTSPGSPPPTPRTHFGRRRTRGSTIRAGAQAAGSSAATASSTTPASPTIA